jgi:hypothetical protein
VLPDELPPFEPPPACAQAPPDSVSALTAVTAAINVLIALFMIRPSLIGLE